MIKVPEIGNGVRYLGPFKDEEGFDPEREDWSRHGEGAKSRHDGVGFLDEEQRDSDIPSWFEDEESDDDGGHPFMRAG